MRTDVRIGQLHVRESIFRLRMTSRPDYSARAYMIEHAHVRTRASTWIRASSRACSRAGLINSFADRYVRGRAFIGNNASWGHSLLCLVNSIY